MHENLATSYVLVEALVADLREGGFSGVVEIMLRDTDAHILIERGKVAAAIESRKSEDDNSNPVTRPYRHTTVIDLAAASRRERGRVSIYGYSPNIASAIAGRANAEPLYTRLSTEFADLEKMISKLGRERDRHWFIEVSTENGLAALVSIKEDGCLILTSREGGPLNQSETPDLIDNAALGDLLDECKRVGGVFDVYFKSAADDSENDEHQSKPLDSQAPASSESNENDVSQAMLEAKAVFESLSVEDSAPELNQQDYEPQDYDPPRAVEITGEMATGEMAASGLLLVQDDLRATGLLKRGSEADVMAEVKRLMGEIARAIEEAIQATEPRNSFSMHLRAGQLKIAERYPFLDPFGAEFEYLAGEIVFVGHASPGQFIEGLTEALKLAVEAAIKSSAQDARLRARITDELEWLLKRQKIELAQHRLDQSIEEIISAVTKD